MIATAFLASLTTCGIIRSSAARRSLVDNPNERSLHTTPTPRLGGVGIVLVVAAITCALLLDHFSRELAIVLGASAAISLVGLVDDLRPVPASIRFALQVGVTVAFFGAVVLSRVDLAPGFSLTVPAWALMILLVVWMVGVLNIYNFMDGMDGLAGSQAITASIAYALLFYRARAPELAVYCALLGASSGGFLMHNFPPARLFMGDAGATFVGLSFAALAVVGMNHDVPITVSALPLAPFLLDGTFTILRRASRREAVWRAHRTHLYQRAVQTGLEHRQVLIVYVAWLVTAMIASLVASTAISVVIAWSANVAILGVLGRWVVLRESKQALAP